MYGTILGTRDKRFPGEQQQDKVCPGYNQVVQVVDNSQGTIRQRKLITTESAIKLNVTSLNRKVENGCKEQGRKVEQDVEINLKPDTDKLIFLRDNEITNNREADCTVNLDEKRDLPNVDGRNSSDNNSVINKDNNSGKSQMKCENSPEEYRLREFAQKIERTVSEFKSNSDKRQGRWWEKIVGRIKK